MKLTPSHYDFPETLNWQHLRSRKLTAAAERIAHKIRTDLGMNARNDVPGLREALRVINDVDGEMD
jgi:hypothetical protein